MDASDSTRLLRIFTPRRLIVGAVLLAAGAAAVWLALPETVETVSLRRRDLVRTLALVGRVRPPSRAGLGAERSGTVREVRVREGDRVRKGQALVVLGDREARAAVSQAEAALTEASASARSAIEVAQNELEQAERNLERVRALRSQGVRSEQDVEEAEQRLADARSRLTAARAPEGEGDDPAAVVRARATLEAARARLAQTRVTAPGNGVVLTRSVEPGDAVQPGRVLLEVALDGPTELVVFPAEENLGQIRVGAPATASADAFPDSTFAATVSLVAPAVDPDQGTVEVRLAVRDPPNYLRPSMTVSVNVEGGRRSGASVLPEEAVRGLGTSTPWVAMVEDGRLVRRDVGVGLRAERWVEIRSGLASEDGVVPPDGSPELGARVRARSREGRSD